MILEQSSHIMSTLATGSPVLPSQAGNIVNCAIDHQTLTAQYKTPRTTSHAHKNIEQDAKGIWHIYGFDQAKTILRYNRTKQLGFKAELLRQMPSGSRTPILYLEGPEHLEQRKQTARFFTPKAVSGYRPVMEILADKMVANFVHSRRADLRQLSLGMAMRVVSEVVGLTNSRIGGIEKRLDVFLREENRFPPRHPLSILLNTVVNFNVFLFFGLDVKPSIEARKTQPKDDLISYLISQNYKDWEIFTECITYAAAGMVTTREFIALAAWHLITQPTLRQRYLQAAEAERHAILQEILRLEPIVTNVQRRAVDDITLESDGQTITIHKDEPIHIHVQTVNADESVVGDNALAVCPMREMHKQVVMPSVMSFGDGHHRCPGAYVAIYETDVLLQRLLKLDGLKIAHEPNFVWSSTASGYEARNFIIEV